MEKEVLVEVSFPRMIITVDLVGTNSLAGALCVELIKNNLIQNIDVLNPDEIVFMLKSVHRDINLYEEINKVRDYLKIDEKKIVVIML